MTQKKLALLFSLLASCTLSFAQTLKVSSQQEFEEAVSRINAGAKLSISLAPGEYILNRNIQATQPLTINGEDAVVTGAYNTYEVKDTLFSTAEYYVYRQRSPISAFPIFIDEKGQQIRISETVDGSSQVNKISSSIIGEYAKKSGIDIKIPLSTALLPLAKKTFPKAFGYFDCGWARVNFSAQRTDKQYLYCKTLDYCNVSKFNYDLTNYKKDIRYVLFNAEPNGSGIYFDEQNVYIPKAYPRAKHLTDLEANASKPTITVHSDLSLKGISFVNINSLHIGSKEQSKCAIQNCTFSNTLENTLIVKKENKGKVSPVTIDNCTFLHCALLSGPIVTLKSDLHNNTCIVFSNCTVSRYPEAVVAYKNCSSAVSVDGDVTLKGNTIYNTCRDLLFLNKGEILCTGNLLYNTPEFNALQDRNLSSDFGLIYCNNVFYSTPEKAKSNTQSIIKIEGNILSSAYAYGGDARGIFIDDGRCDVTCANNVILDTQIYSIDSRNAGNYTGQSSLRNRISNNVLEKRYRLEVSDGVTSENKSTASSNCIIGSGQKNVIKNVLRTKEDREIPLRKLTVSAEKRKVMVSKQELSKLKKLSFWSSIKNCFSTEN